MTGKVPKRRLGTFPHWNRSVKAVSPIHRDGQVQRRDVGIRFDDEGAPAAEGRSRSPGDLADLSGVERCIGHGI
jgi:hypothetical protein